MTPLPSLRSRSTVQDPTRVAAKRFLMMALSDFPFTARSVRVAALTRRSVAVEGTVQLVTRSSVSLSHSNLILASVFGSVGFVAFVALVILLVRYWMRHRHASEDMIIERPSHMFQDPQETSPFQNAPLSPPIQNAPAPITSPTLDTPDRAYIPNHPYALNYDSRNSFPPTPSPKTTTHPQIQHPPLPSLTMSHPYIQSNRPQRRERIPSADPSTIYESFMSSSPTPTPDPVIEAMEPSPLASTVGGAISHQGSHFDTLLSTALSEEAPSNMSESSSAPLQVGEKRPHR